MKVKDLIEKLKELDENTEIGYYDMGRDEVTDILSIGKASEKTPFEKGFKSDFYII